MSEKLSAVEHIKTKSDGLRGTLKESIDLDNHTGNVRPDDETLVKFHGMYVQDDRDRRAERAAKKLDKLYSFMIRLRIPGGVINANQWIATHEISEQFGTGTLKITTRQTVQLHGLLKHQLRPTIQAFNTAKLDSIAACGDVNRNVIVSSHPQISAIHQQIYEYADKISTLLLPKTQSYYEVFIDGEKIYERSSEADPLYEDRYLPRKFKIAIATPPSNDVDVFTNDIGLIAIIENNELKGFNIAIGGGLATTHGNPNTYSRLGSIIGFTDTEEKTLKAVYEILTVQRDFGNRVDRKLSRLKYTVDKLTVEGFKKELESRIGFEFEPERKYTFTERSDRFEWEQNHQGKWFYTLFIEHGVVKPEQKQFLYELAQLDISNFIFSGNQNLILGEIDEIYSDILSETRVLNIYLPEGYNKHDTISYPVIYLLDASFTADMVRYVAGAAAALAVTAHLEVPAIGLLSKVSAASRFSRRNPSWAVGCSSCPSMRMAAPPSLRCRPIGRLPRKRKRLRAMRSARVMCVWDMATVLCRVRVGRD